MPQPESVVLLVPGFPASEAETDCLPPLQSFVKALACRNPDLAIQVISFQYPFKRGTYAWHGATVHALDGKNRRFPMRAQTWIQAARIVRRLIRSHKVIALHSMWLAECTYVASWISRLNGTRHIATIRGQDALATNPYLKHLPFDRMTVTAGSERAAEAFQESTGRRVDRIVPTGLDSEALCDRGQTFERTIDILGVGSLSPIKDFGSFLEIVSVLSTNYQNLRCRIIGDGPERPLLEGYIQEHKLEDVARLAGHVPREVVLSTMRKSRILLHTSRYEGQGYVFLEALASGMRVVSRDVGFAGSGTGVYRCKSNEEMLHVLTNLLATPMDNLDSEVLRIDVTADAFEGIYRTAERGTKR